MAESDLSSLQGWEDSTFAPVHSGSKAKIRFTNRPILALDTAPVQQDTAQAQADEIGLILGITPCAKLRAAPEGPISGIAALLPRASGLSLKPRRPPVTLQVSQSSVGWKLLEASGWREGQSLGLKESHFVAQPETQDVEVDMTLVERHEDELHNADEGRGIKVPLKHEYKNDRLGIGLKKRSKIVEPRNDDSAGPVRQSRARQIRRKYKDDSQTDRRRLAYFNT